MQRQRSRIPFLKVILIIINIIAVGRLHHNHGRATGGVSYRCPGKGDHYCRYLHQMGPGKE